MLENVEKTEKSIACELPLPYMMNHHGFERVEMPFLPFYSEYSQFDSFVNVDLWTLFVGSIFLLSFG